MGNGVQGTGNREADGKGTLAGSRSALPSRRAVRLAGFLLLATLAVVLCSKSAPAMDFGSRVETHRIRVTNLKGAPVELSPDGGQTWIPIGSVLKPAKNLVEGYAATRWAQNGRVAAVAVHGVHICVRKNERGRGMLFSVVPSEFLSPPPNFGGHIPRESGIYVTMKAGTLLFRDLAPFVKDEVLLGTGVAQSLLPGDYVPRAGDVITLIVKRAMQGPSAIAIENRLGGRAWLEFPDGQTTDFGRVMRPARGVGRFDATGFNSAGSLNTVHTGVVTISTAPDLGGLPEYTREDRESRGGFMIQPHRHAAEETVAHDQALVIAPADPSATGLEGQPPLFSGFLSLAFSPEDPQASYRCEMQVDGGPWEPLIEYVGIRSDLFTAEGLNAAFIASGSGRTCTIGVTAFRIVLPTHRY